MLLDRLLTALNVEVQGFAICEVSSGWRLAFGPERAPTVHYTLAGTGILRAGPRRILPVAQDSFVLLPRMLAHSFETNGGGQELHVEGPYSNLTQGLQRLRAGDGADLVTACGSIRASYGQTLDLFDHLAEPVVASFADTPVLRDSFRALLDELSAPAIGTRALVETLLKQCLVLLLRQQSSVVAGSAPWLAALQDPHLSGAISAMVEHPDHPFTLEDLAKKAGTGRSAFVKRFHAAFRKSPFAFLKELRLREAARLLATTELPIKVIAGRVGYSSRSYFSRAFSKLYGMDPSQFRSRGGAASLENGDRPSGDSSVGESQAIRTG